MILTLFDRNIHPLDDRSPPSLYHARASKLRRLVVRTRRALFCKKYAVAWG
jgi:hypothetical protein